VAGYYVKGETAYGFQYDGTKYTTLSPPNATSTEAFGVIGGNVVGFYIVPDPPGFVLLGIGLARTAESFAWQRRAVS
jgi:hypothetical protein